jgi:hypothetical protein
MIVFVFGVMIHGMGSKLRNCQFVFLLYERAFDKHKSHPGAIPPAIIYTSQFSQIITPTSRSAISQAIFPEQINHPQYHHHSTPISAPAS